MTGIRSPMQVPLADVWIASGFAATLRHDVEGRNHYGNAR
jgi:hypothetical protein